ncbi:hypothetical protein B0H66DRAFT_644968 [Apodospora peruviana]|uniref:Dolichyldiphosphatase n=1 Tax=Apodospora peruviana TaxID=516989 RepID=A0AAE0LXW1_9PEZI|nr:hypothetical protein B0H66DRAFT_644968 [Apodospora peruviana]
MPLLRTARDVLGLPSPRHLKLQLPNTAVHGSRFTVHGSRFTVHGSRFTVHGSRFTVHGSRFTVHGSRFTVHGSRFTNPDDPVSLLCAWLALVPQALCVVYVTLIWSTREAEVALMFAGQLGCEAVNFALKRLIKEERPARIHRTGKGYGMPSSHAQFAVFWAIALSLFLLVRHRPSPSLLLKQQRRYDQIEQTDNNNTTERRTPSPQPSQSITYYYRYYKDTGGLTAITADIERYAHEPWTFAQRSLASAAALVLAAFVAWSRVYLGYHTEKQVLVGCAAGAVSAVGWFGLTHVVRQTGLLAFALDLPVARWFRLRDLVVEESVPGRLGEVGDEKERRAEGEDQ